MQNLNQSQLRRHQQQVKMKSLQHQRQSNENNDVIFLNNVL
jgi:hypothetical protein